ncbi:hypothetical protein AMTRI_Chr02g266020 [Amborella trichopoda]
MSSLYLKTTQLPSPLHSPVFREREEREKMVSVMVVLAIVLCFFLALLYLAEKKNPKLGFPGQYGWPIVRENFTWYRSTSQTTMLDFLQPRISRYGRIFMSHLFGKPSLLSVDPEFNKWVMQNEGKLFKAMYTVSFRKAIGKYGLIAVHGDLQRKLHGIAVNLLAPDKLRSHYMADVESRVINSVASWIGEEVRLQDECHKIVSELMCKQLLDLDSIEEMEEIDKEFVAFTKTVLCFPIAFPGTNFAKGMKARKALDTKIYKAIKDREDHPEVQRGDLLTRLLREEKPLPTEVVVDFIIFLLFAGHETSSRSMTLAVKFITDHPDVLERLREEQDAIAKNKKGERLTWEDYTSMNYTQCVINETLRMSSVSPMVLRESTEDVEFDGHTIPKGTHVVLMSNGVHRDSEYFTSPLVFNPDRWWDFENDKFVNYTCFSPFGGGARLCPGAQLARLEIAILLHYLVTRCSWKLVKEDRITEFPLPTLVEGLPLRVFSRL